ncbi:MAG: hypothetical protein IJ394_02395 [Bacteroidales bacterium]|nr:hypothetical protein [Bacteroidales bacterium]
MKKILIILISALMPVAAGAQAQINTKKIKIADFPEKVTKVVLTGNDFFDLALQEDVAARWRVSPYEFCTLDEFETLKTDANYYFLLTAKTRFKRENAPGLHFMTLIKGGPEAEKGIGEMLEVVSMPIASAEDPSGREFAFLQAFLDIIQSHTVQSVESDVVGYAGLAHHTDNIRNCAGKRIVFAKGDISSQITEDIIDRHYDKDIHVLDEEDADKFIVNVVPNTLVSIVVAPADAPVGSYCYKMLIDSETHTLFYFRRHKITRKDGVGFLAEDIKKISSHR